MSSRRHKTYFPHEMYVVRAKHALAAFLPQLAVFATIRRPMTIKNTTDHKRYHADTTSRVLTASSKFRRKFRRHRHSPSHHLPSPWTSQLLDIARCAKESEAAALRAAYDRRASQQALSKELGNTGSLPAGKEMWRVPPPPMMQGVEGEGKGSTRDGLRPKNVRKSEFRC